MVLQTEDADALVGQTIGGRFTITRLIAKGGMAVVYEAEQRLGTTTRKVALKTLRIQSVSDPSMADRFKRECETIAQLSHPNTVRVYDFGETDDGLLYIAMEFVAGKPLSHIMDEVGPMPPARVSSILRQISGALEEAHGQGIVHRDLKPDNVAIQLLTNHDDAVKLLDFGIAIRSVGVQNYSKLTRAGIVLGTPPYMSPEQFTPDPIDARSDVYALGAMAYEMLTGHLPLEADTPWAWAVAHQTAQPVPFEVLKPAVEIPRPMRQAILRALSKSRDERQASAKQFFEEFSAPSNTSPMDAPPTFQPVMGTTPMPAVASVAPSALAPVHIGPGSVAAPGSVAVPGAYAVTSMAPRRPSRWPVYTLAAIVVLLAGALVILGRPFLFPEEEPPPPFPSTAPVTSGALAPPSQPPQDEDEPTKPRRPNKPTTTVTPRPAAPTPPTAAPSATPDETTPTPSASAPSPTPPAAGVLQCQSDAQCGFNRCDTQVNRCIWPCRSDGDCRAGASCNALLGTCVPAAQPTPGALPSASP
ncbi:MAG TPA: protein kinase [Polyangiaceae bacterium]|nr:protein kinase [Polyangiaceae bacterium]